MMNDKARGPEWRGDDSFGPGWGNQTAHEAPPAGPAAGERFGRDAAAGGLARGAGEAGPDFTIRSARWREDVEKIAEHMEVVGADGAHVGTVDKLRGEHIILTKGDSPDDEHHGLPFGWIDTVDDKVRLNLAAAEARSRWRAEGRSRALFEREDAGSDGPHILERSFSGTYPEEKK